MRDSRDTNSNDSSPDKRGCTFRVLSSPAITALTDAFAHLLQGYKFTGMESVITQSITRLPAPERFYKLRRPRVAMLALMLALLMWVGV